MAVTHPDDLARGEPSPRNPAPNPNASTSDASGRITLRCQTDTGERTFLARRLPSIDRVEKYRGAEGDLLVFSGEDMAFLPAHCRMLASLQHPLLLPILAHGRVPAGPGAGGYLVACGTWRGTLTQHLIVDDETIGGLRNLVTELREVLAALQQAGQVHGAIGPDSIVRACWRGDTPEGWRLGPGLGPLPEVPDPLMDRVGVGEIVHRALRLPTSPDLLELCGLARCDAMRALWRRVRWGNVGAVPGLIQSWTGTPEPELPPFAPIRSEWWPVLHEFLTETQQPVSGRSSSRLPAPSGLLLQPTGDRFWATWEWPAKSTVARLVVRTDRFPVRPDDGEYYEIALANYNSSGGLWGRIPERGRMLYATVFLVEQTLGGVIASTGATWSGVGVAVRLGYELVPLPGRRSTAVGEWFEYDLTLASDRNIRLPELLLVGSRDREPTRIEEGHIVAAVPPQVLFARRPVTLRVRVADRAPWRLRLFAPECGPALIVESSGDAN